MLSALAKYIYVCKIDMCHRLLVFSLHKFEIVVVVVLFKNEQSLRT